MATLFLPRAQNFNASTAAGSGDVIRWTYTVPTGKRAVVTHLCLVLANNANVANTTIGYFQVTIAGTGITVGELNNSGIANITPLAIPTQIDLGSGDTITGRSVNTGANAVVMTIEATIKEYQ